MPTKRSTGGCWRAATTRPGTRSCAPRWRSCPLIEVDLHMHTDHSGDCATPVEVLLQTRARPGAGRDRDHRPQRGLRGARGGGDRGRDAGPEGDRRRGGKDRRAGRGDRPLPSRRRSRRGSPMAETVAAIREQGGLVYVAASVRPASTRCPTTSTCWTWSRRSTCWRSSTRAVALTVLQRGGGALRGQVPDRLRRPGRTPTSPRGWAACRQRIHDFDAGRRSSSRRCGTPTSPASTRISSTSRP